MPSYIFSADIFYCNCVKTIYIKWSLYLLRSYMYFLALYRTLKNTSLLSVYCKHAHLVSQSSTGCLMYGQSADVGETVTFFSFQHGVPMVCACHGDDVYQCEDKPNLQFNPKTTKVVFDWTVWIIQLRLAIAYLVIKFSRNHINKTHHIIHGNQCLFWFVSILLF